MECDCAERVAAEKPAMPECECPQDEHGLVLHMDTCLLYKAESFVYPPMIPVACEVCKCPRHLCTCSRIGREGLDEWRLDNEMQSLPAALDPSHPLMARFQDTLKRFLERENAIAEEKLLELRDQLKNSKAEYQKDLERIYIKDHDIDAQRALILEYEDVLAKNTADREATEARERKTTERYKEAKSQLDKDIIREREAREEMESLTTLVNQLTKWRDETDADMLVGHRVSDKMRVEKKSMASEKRQLDTILYFLTNEIWKLESKLEMFNTQIGIKTKEMNVFTDRVTAYATELEDLELDRRRLMYLWNSVLVNIKQRDKVYDSVAQDFSDLKENCRTLIHNLDVTKKITAEEMIKGKEISFYTQKLTTEMNAIQKLFDAADSKKIAYETEIAALSESMLMTERDQDMIKSENHTMNNIVTTTTQEYLRRKSQQQRLESDILKNLNECMLNDKAFQAMSDGLRKMRDMTTKQELGLADIENQHAKLMFDIEIYQTKKKRQDKYLNEKLEQMHQQEGKCTELEEILDQRKSILFKKQREYDCVIKKYYSLKEIFDDKSPQERRIRELEMRIRAMRACVEERQQEWLRLQGHVVKLATQYHTLLFNIAMSNKQIQICDQKSMRIQAECDNVEAARLGVERELRDLRGRLELLARSRRDAVDTNADGLLTNNVLSFEYTARLKEAESDMIQMEDETRNLENEKLSLTSELDSLQKQALIWQRKGILAVELKKNMASAKTATGEIGQLKAENHRKEVHRETLRRTEEKLADEMANWVKRRGAAMDKMRSSESRPDGTLPSIYIQKLRLVKADLASVEKDLSERRTKYEDLENEEKRLKQELKQLMASSRQLEEKVADTMRQCVRGEIMRQWLFERVVRKQRYGKDMQQVLARQSLRTSKSKEDIESLFAQAQEFNKKMNFILKRISNEIPFLSDKMELIQHTLDISSPSQSPRERAPCFCVDKPEKPYCDAPGTSASAPKG